MEPRVRQRYRPASSGRKLAISKRPLQPRTRPAGARRLPSLYQWPLRSAHPQHNRTGCPRATVSSCSCCSGLGARQGSVGRGQRAVSWVSPLHTENMLHTHGRSTPRHMLDTAAPPRTHNHMLQTVCAGQMPRLWCISHTRCVAHMLDRTCHCPGNTHIHTRHMLQVPRIGHTPTPLGHITLIVHTPHMLAGPPKPHTQRTEHTHATHAHTHTAKGLTTSSAAHLRALHPARPVSLVDTEIGGCLLGARH